MTVMINVDLLKKSYVKRRALLDLKQRIRELVLKEVSPLVDKVEGITWET